jgi:hypothetical protein
MHPLPPYQVCDTDVFELHSFAIRQLPLIATTAYSTEERE